MNASATAGLPTQESGPDTIHHELRDGDYQIIVHVIEARKLKAIDQENGTADPVLVAKLEFPSSVVPKWQNSPRKVNTLNPVWGAPPAPQTPRPRFAAQPSRVLLRQTTP